MPKREASSSRPMALVKSPLPSASIMMLSPTPWSWPQAFITKTSLTETQAMPGIGDPRFERAVIFLCAHNDEHAMGLTVNRPVEGLTVPNLLQRLGVEGSIEAPEDLVLMGGPVERERGFVLHTDDYQCESS